MAPARDGGGLRESPPGLRRRCRQACAVPRLNSRSRRRPPESSPAAPSRRGSPRCRFPFRRLAALAGGFRRSLPAAILLASAALVPVLPISSAVAQEVVEVPRNSPLKPSGLAAAQKEFRLLFVTSTRRNAISTDIADYNSFVQGSAAAGHSSIRPFASQFRVVGSTGSVDARDNTSTTYTSSDKGVPIYWVRGNKVADEYEDFYDGGWDDERNVRDERGNGHSRLGPLRGGGIWTGSSNDGTAHASDPLGGSVPGSFAPVRQGRLGGSSPSSRTPLSHQTGSNTAALGFYALSPVIRLVDLVEVTGVSMQSSPASGDTYAAEETITVRLTFTEAVNVTGRPFVYLNVGGALGKAVYGAGSGSANLDFSYTVQASDFDANGVSICSSRLLDPACGQIQLDGGAIVAAADSARAVVDTLWPLVEQGSLAIPRGGYIIRRGHHQTRAREDHRGAGAVVGRPTAFRRVRTPHCLLDIFSGVNHSDAREPVLGPAVVRRAIVPPHNRMESVGYRADRRQDLALNNNADGV